MKSKTCFLIWYTHPSEQTQSTASGENNSVSKSADKVDAFNSKLQLQGGQVNIEIFDKFHKLADILKEIEPALSSPSWYIVTYLRFNEWTLLTDHKGFLNCEGFDLWISQVNWLSLCYKRINCLQSQITMALKVCLRQFKISICSGLNQKSSWDCHKTLRTCFHFLHAIFEK